MIAAFISIMLLIVARHHPPSRRKIKQIWHGRVYWESNTTMLRRPALNVSEAPQNVLSNNIKEPIASISKNDLSISKNDASISKNDDSTSKSDDSTSKNDDSTSKSDASLSNDKDSVQVHNYESIHALLHSVNPNACTKHKILKGDNSKEPDVHVCMDNISPPCVVYSFGIANIWIFDDFMISQGCHVFSFDPSMNVGKHKRHENHLFEPIGIGSKSGRHGGPTTLINGQTNYDVLTLGDIMKRYNHERVTLVRMDTEYAEWDVLQQWENDNMFSKIDQLLLEIHMWPKSSHRNHGQLHSEILHSIPMTLFHEAQNKWDRTRLAGDMTRVYEVGFITESQPTTEPKKIDIFHVNHEKAMWRMRFEEHWDFVDEFHIFESSVSHQGKPKRLYFKESRNEFKQYASKIVYHEINSDYNSDACKKTGNWKCETHDRIEIAKAMNGILRDDDIVIFSDVDEFVFEDVLAKLEKQPSLLPTRIRTPVYKYSLHWKQQKSDKWKSCIVARAAYVKKYNDWNNLRRKNDITATIEHGGLHLSTFGSIDEIVTKSLHSRTKRILDRGDVVKRVNNGISLWDINKHFVYEENVPILPKLAKSDPGYFEEHFMRYGKAKKKPVVRPEQNEAEEAPSKTFFFEKMVDAVEEYSKYSPVLWDMDCWPHYPTYGGSETNFISGTRATCRKINEKKFCSYLDTLDDEKTYVWINQHSNSDRKTLPWDKCRRTNVFYTYISFGDTRPPNDIPIPTHTTPNEKYPASELENTKRCEDASLHVSFVGQMKTPVRQKISNQFSSYPLAKIESNPKGWKNSRMFDLLYTSKFGLVPRGDAMFSYRLMETMAMGVVPIIISDGWQLPFEDMLDWSEFSIRVREDDISTLPSVIEAYRDKACEMSAKVYDVYHKYMATPKAIVEAIDKQIGMYTRPASTQTTAKISIVSWLASEWSNKGYEAMLKNRKAYARKHGYTFLDFDETNLPTPELRLNYQQLSHYIKQPLILAVMEDCKPEDWVIWMDADTMFTNDQKKWEQYLSGDMVFAEAPDVIANNGIFALRCNDWGRFFIRLWSEECKTMKTGGRLQNPEAKAGDNAPFVHALLRAFAHTHNVNYDNNCRQENGWGALVRCYNRQIEAIVQESGLSRTRGPNEELGSGLVSDPHITGVWGINSGLGFKPPNDWHEGDFILHLAGKGKKDRDTLGLKYSATVKEGVTSTLETPQMSNTVRECALLFFGLAKHFNDIVYPSIQKYILNINPDCDVYAHTYDIKEITNPRNKEDHTPVNPLEVYSMTDNVILDTLESVSKAIDFDYYHKHYKQKGGVFPYSMDNSLKQWFSIQRVWESMPSKYKRVGLFRLDVLYTEPVNIQNGDAVIPDFHHWGGLNDRGFYGLYKWAGQWATNRLKKLAIRSKQDNIYDMNAEHFMKYMMRDVPVELKPMCFNRVRATGKIKNDCKPTLVATKPSITPVSANSIQKSYTSNVRLENGVIVKTLKGNLKGYNMIQREKCVLDRLKKFKWAPKVLSSTDNIMKMTYMGEKVNKENIPLDYADQMNQILTDMESVDVQHNDMIYPCAVKSFRKHEVMVLNGRLSIVDFGWATINDSVPCGVSTKKFVPNWNPCPDKTILQVLKNYKKDNFVSYRNKKRKVGSQSETPSFKVLGNANIRIGGYQRFDINLKTKLVSNIRSYKDKFNWVKQTLINLRLSGMQGFMDIGCNNGLSSFLAQEVGYDNVISLDHDSEAIHVLKQVVDLQSTSVIHPREFSFGNPFNNKVDVVLCGALIHWVFTCTADFGKFDLILQYLLNTGLKILLLEWVDPKDPAIKKFHHLNCGTKPKETYSVSNFEKSVLKVGNIREKWPLPRRPTRVMYQIEIYHN